MLDKGIQPTLIVKGYYRALDDALNLLEDLSIKIPLDDDEKLLSVVASALGTKFSTQWGAVISNLALRAARPCIQEYPDGRRDIGVKKYARIEKIPGGLCEDCRVVPGIIINKDVPHGKMKRMIRNPCILLLDCPLEYEKGESMTNVEITKEDEFEKLLLQEEEEVKRMCDNIAKVGCDLVITEKGVSDLAAHFLMKKGIAIIRRAKKTDVNRIARATGATIVNRTEELLEGDVGTRCRLFKIEKIDDEYWTFLTDCDDPKACTVILRGGSKDVLKEVERNLNDALSAAKNILVDGKLLPGGGATEAELYARLTERSAGVEGLAQWGYRAVAQCLEVIPRTLAQNSGSDVIRTVAALRAAHAAPGQATMGINGVTGEIVDVTAHGIWDVFAVKSQILKTAVECSSMLMRVDDMLSGIGRKAEPKPEVTNYGPGGDPIP